MAMVIHMIGSNFKIHTPRSTCQLTKKMLQRPSKLKQWKHLESIVGKISQKEDISVGLWIGANCANALETIDIIPSKNDGTYAFKTKLGWCIVGPINRTSRKEICCNRIGVRQADTNEVGKHFFQAKTLVKESGSPEGKSENGMSVEDLKFMKENHGRWRKDAK